MECNVGKCEVAHSSRKNRKAEYVLNRGRMWNTAAQRVLGAIVHESHRGMQVQQEIKISGI